MLVGAGEGYGTFSVVEADPFSASAPEATIWTSATMRSVQMMGQVESGHMRTVAALALLAALTACSGNEAGSPPDEGIVIAGAIRPDADGNWTLIEDDTHRPRGVESVEVEPNGNLVIHYSDEGSAVVTFVTTPDETFAESGITVGASAGLDRAILTLSEDPDYTNLGGSANVWFYGILEP